jgi:hypothetical protein
MKAYEEVDIFLTLALDEGKGLVTDTSCFNFPRRAPVIH